REHIEMPVLVAANKIDLLDEEPGSGFDATMSTLTGVGVDEMMERMVSMIDMEKYDVTIEMYDDTIDKNF
ncbi:MAG: hypothetical protein KAR76_03400, partial [Methanosarcinales archaeon]|nr:hypothetical protein [Methanosarcinales archaeon]